jgi:hypothetical protein
LSDVEVVRVRATGRDERRPVRVAATIQILRARMIPNMQIALCVMQFHGFVTKLSIAGVRFVLVWREASEVSGFMKLQ